MHSSDIVFIGCYVGLNPCCCVSSLITSNNRWLVSTFDHNSCVAMLRLHIFYARSNIESGLVFSVACLLTLTKRLCHHLRQSVAAGQLEDRVGLFCYHYAVTFLGYLLCLCWRCDSDWTSYGRNQHQTCRSILTLVIAMASAFRESC